MEDAAVRKEDLGRLHLALGHVLVPGFETPRHEGRAERIEVAAHGLVGDAEGASELRTIPDLGVVVSEHRPEPPHRRGGKPDPQRREIALEIGADELLTPAAARRLRPGEIGKREAAAEPQLLEVIRPDLLQNQAAELVIGDAPGEGLGALPEQAG